MPYSVGGVTLTPEKGDTSAALKAVGDAYSTINDSYDKIAKLPFMAKNMIQDDADARYTAALNKYSNDPTGLANALANGEIDTSNVRAETLGKTQDTLGQIQKTGSLNYLQGRLENYYNYLDNPENARALEAAQQAAYHGDIQGVNNYISNFNGPAELLAERLSKFNPQKASNELEELAIARYNAATGRMEHGLAQQKYNAELLGIAAANKYNRARVISGANFSPKIHAALDEAIQNGEQFFDAVVEQTKIVNGKQIKTQKTVRIPLDGILEGFSASPKGYQYFHENSSYNALKSPTSLETPTNTVVTEATNTSDKSKTSEEKGDGDDKGDDSASRGERALLNMHS